MASVRLKVLKSMLCRGRSSLLRVAQDTGVDGPFLLPLRVARDHWASEALNIINEDAIGSFKGG